MSVTKMNVVTTIFTHLRGKLNCILTPLLLQYTEQYGLNNEFEYDVARNLEKLSQNGTPSLPRRIVEISFTVRCCMAHQILVHIY